MTTSFSSLKGALWVKPAAVTTDMRSFMIRSGVLLSALLALMANIPASAAATSPAKKTMPVSATVKVYVHLAPSLPSQLVLSKDDVQEGYVDVPGKSNPTPINLSVTTNDRAGYLLQFGVASSMTPMLTSIAVAGIGPSFSLEPTGGSTSLAYGANKTTFTPVFRFVLSHKARTGTYAWPLTIAAQAN